MNFVRFIITSLAVWRLSHAMAKENGPLMVFARLRAYLAGKQKRSGGLFDMVSCIACLSFWIGLVAALWVAGGVLKLLGYALAFSAVAVLLESLLSSNAKTGSTTEIKYDLKNLDSLKMVAPPASDNQITVRRSSPSKKRYDMVNYPNSLDRKPTIKT